MLPLLDDPGPTHPFFRLECIGRQTSSVFGTENSLLPLPRLGLIHRSKRPAESVEKEERLGSCRPQEDQPKSEGVERI